MPTRLILLIMGGRVMKRRAQIPNLMRSNLSLSRLFAFITIVSMYRFLTRQYIGCLVVKLSSGTNPPTSAIIFKLTSINRVAHLLTYLGHCGLIRGM